MLRGKEVWSIVSGTEPTPLENDVTAIAQYLHRKDVALTNIILYIEHSCCSRVEINLEEPTMVSEKFQAIHKGVFDACNEQYL